MQQTSIIIFRVKKEISNYPFHVSFDGETFNFLETCANCSVVNLDYDFSLVTNVADVHYNFQREKRDFELSISCQFCWSDI